MAVLNMAVSTLSDICGHLPAANAKSRKPKDSPRQTMPTGKELSCNGMVTTLTAQSQEGGGCLARRMVDTTKV